MAYHHGIAALGDDAQAIFERLARQPTSVGKLAEGLPVSRPAVSQHLRVLMEAALVTSARGHASVYRVDPRGSTPCAATSTVLGPSAGGVQRSGRIGGRVSTMPRQRVGPVELPTACLSVFTDGIDRWWPREHHIGKSPLERFVIEPKPAVGGTRPARRSECDMGRVLAWEPSSRVLLPGEITSSGSSIPTRHRGRGTSPRRAAAKSRVSSSTATSRSSSPAADESARRSNPTAAGRARSACSRSRSAA